MRRQPRNGAGRAEVAAIAARILVEGGARDFEDARRRALRELGTVGRRDVPDNREVHAALISHLDLFQREAQAQRMRRMRRAALEALELLAPFAPRLCGPVWYGTAGEHTAISVHLACDETEAVTRFLLEQCITYRLDEVAFRFPGGIGVRRMPQYRVERCGEVFELSVFPEGGARSRPLSSLDDKPVKRAGVRELESLLESGCLFADEFAGSPRP